MSSILNTLAAASRPWIGDAPTGAMLSAMRAFLAAAPDDEALLREAAASLSSLEPGSAAFVAVAIGSAVERGAKAETTAAAVLGELRSWLPRLPAGGNEETPPVPTPEQAMLLARFQFLCQSAVTHLAKLPELRAELARDPALIKRLDDLRGYSHGAWWVYEALLKASGTITLLHPPSGAGVRLRYANVSNCFHLFSLLQTAVGARIPGGQTREGPGADGDRAWWHYGSPLSPKAEIGASIWGEGLVRDIPRVDGEQVMLLWPPILEDRAWDSGFSSPHLEALPASVVVEATLTPEESKAWLDKLGVSRRRQPWWKRWLSGAARSLAAIGIVLIVCGGDANGADRKVPVQLGDDCYQIPKWNAALIEASPFPPFRTKRENTRSLTLRFANERVAQSLPGYPVAPVGLARSLQVGYFLPTAEERAQQQSNKKRAHHDVWYALGDYRARTLEPIPGTGFVRVYPLAGGASWMVVTRSPDSKRRDTHLQKDFWIATCGYFGERRDRSCTLDVDVGPMSISLDIAEAELPRREALARYAVRTLKTWQVRCGN